MPRPFPSSHSHSNSRAAHPPLDDIDRALINHLHGGFPLVDEPYAEVGRALGLTESQVLARIEALLAGGVLSRFGPLFQVERLGGAFCLAAMQVPEARWDEVVALVNARPEVAHNYGREHRFNLWFVLATAAPAGIAAAQGEIEAATGLPVTLFPKEKEYFVELRLEA